MKLPGVLTCVGADCSPDWHQYLRRSEREVGVLARNRLQECVGVTHEELQDAERRLDDRPSGSSSSWPGGSDRRAAAATLLEQLLAKKRDYEVPGAPALRSALGRGPAPATSTLCDLLEPRRRLRDEGLAGAAAMPPRLRRGTPGEAPPSLPSACKLCEASFPTSDGLRKHVRRVHGGDQRAREAWLCLEEEKPHLVTAAEKRRVVANFSSRYQHAAPSGRHELSEAGAGPGVEPVEPSYPRFWCELYRALAARHEADPQDLQGVATLEATLDRGDRPKGSRTATDTEAGDAPPAAAAQPPQLRKYLACAFCALQYWNDELSLEFIAGDDSFMDAPAKVAALLSADWYKEQWPLIPPEELDASSVDLPYLAEDKVTLVTTKVLMHKRRVPEGACAGTERVPVCRECKDCYKGQNPRLCKYALSNFLWLGRHPPLLRKAPLGHQLLLALGRVVSTKVYLSSKGVDEHARQHAETWRQQFLQSGIQGTSIVFGNGSSGAAMESFPPSTEDLRDTFVAVFTGPEHPTADEQEAIDGEDKKSEDRRLQMAQQRLKKEVELAVSRGEFEAQARRLQETNQVYADAQYVRKHVDDLPETPAVPSCFTACARFVRVDPYDEDVVKASGPASATTAGEQESAAGAAADAAELDKWLSVVDEALSARDRPLGSQILNSARLGVLTDLQRATWNP